MAVINTSANGKDLTLQDAILIARTQSVDAAVALGELKSAYWSYRSYRANLLPEINFSSIFPSYSKSYNAYQTSSGSYTFVQSNYLQASGSINIVQNISLTGGTATLSSSIDYLNQLSEDKNHRFLSTPILLKLNQPLFGINTFKWNRKIEPVKYAEAQAIFLSATERVTMQTISYFFGLILAREKVGIAKQNLKNAEKLYEVSKVKRGMGRLSENDLMQMNLNVLKAKSTLTESESNMHSSMFALTAFLGMDENAEIIPILPDTIDAPILNYGKVLEQALRHNSHALNIRRRQLEADYAVAQAKAGLRSVNMFAQLGYNGTNKNFLSAYENLRPQQILEIGVNIPLLDWGKRKGRVRVAESNREVVESRMRQEETAFRQNLFVLVDQFNHQMEQLRISAQADTLAQHRYEAGVETFLLGRISTLDLNDAQVGKDEARQRHINELFNLWYYYYQLRSLTLWDWIKNESLDEEFEDIVKRYIFH